MHQIRNYLIYRAKSVNEHGVHSPFVFDLLLSTIYNKKNFYAYLQIEKMRDALCLSNEVVECKDLGAGSIINNNSKKSLSAIVSSAAKPKKYSQLFIEKGVK